MQQKRGSHASTTAFDQVFALGGWDANAFLVCLHFIDNMNFKQSFARDMQHFMIKQLVAPFMPETLDVL